MLNNDAHRVLALDPTLAPVRCDACGGNYKRDANGRAICTHCRALMTFESLLADGLAPVWLPGAILAVRKTTR